MDGEDFGVVVVSFYLGHQVVEVRLGQHDHVCEGGELIHSQVLLVDQLGLGDGRHPGIERSSIRSRGPADPLLQESILYSVQTP